MYNIVYVIVFYSFFSLHMNIPNSSDILENTPVEVESVPVEVKNIPNVLDDNLDQVAKTGERYQKRLNSPELSQEIEKAFDSFYEVEFDEGVEDFFIKNQEKLPMRDIISHLLTKGTLSLEIWREKKIHKWGRDFPFNAPLLYLSSLELWEVVSKGSEDISEHIISYLTFRLLQRNPLKIHLEGNKVYFPKTGSDLKSVPKEEGAFVYVPEKTVNARTMTQADFEKIPL